MENQRILNEIKALIKTNAPQKWLSIKDCVKYSGLSESTIRRAMQSGQLKANKVGGKWLIRNQWLQSYLTK